MKFKGKYIFLSIPFIIFSSCIYETRDYNNEEQEDKEGKSIEKEWFSPKKETERKEDQFYTRLSVPYKSYRLARIDLQMQAGEFYISGGTKNLVDAEYTYMAKNHAPDLRYDEVDNGVVIHSKMPEMDLSNIHFNDKESDKCEITLNRRTPTDLSVKFGAGEGNFDLTGMALRKVKFEMGAGEFNIKISDVPLQIFDLSAGVGEATVDFRGNWKQNLKASFKCGIGELKIKVPHDVNVSVELNGLLGSIDAPSFKRHSRKELSYHGGDGLPEIKMYIQGGLGNIVFIVD